MLSCVEHKKSFISSRPVLPADSNQPEHALIMILCLCLVHEKNISPLLDTDCRLIILVTRICIDTFSCSIYIGVNFVIFIIIKIQMSRNM